MNEQLEQGSQEVGIAQEDNDKDRQRVISPKTQISARTISKALRRPAKEIK